MTRYPSIFRPTSHRLCAFAIVAPVALTACGARVPGGSPPLQTDTSDSLGWSIRDDTPYPRSGHVAVLDEEGDRMIVYGGSANDTWALPLSGQRADQWTKLIPEGAYPPAHSSSFSLVPDSAIFDPFGKRMLVLRNTSDPEAVSLWELSLAATPVWRQVVPAGPSPGVEAQFGRMVLDRAGKRAILVGGGVGGTGTWALSLDGAPTWTRLGGAPPVSGIFVLGGTLVLDARRAQLVFASSVEGFWGFSLAAGTWTKLADASPSSGNDGTATAIDADNDRLVFFDGNNGVSTFSLATNTWKTESAGTPIYPIGATAVLDPKRGRLLYFSGTLGGKLVNTTWALALDTLGVTELVAGSRSGDISMDDLTAVWDPIRGAVLAFGGYNRYSGAEGTLQHTLAAADAWTRLSAGTPPAISFEPGTYDPIGEAVVAFGGYQFEEQKDVVRLSSRGGAVWETVPVGVGPLERSRHVAIYDPTKHRLVIYGGWRHSSYPATEVFDDTWALSLDGAPAWTQLETQGASPGKRVGHVGVYDPVHQQMIVYGGWGRDETLDPPATDLHALALGDAPLWSELSANGQGPGQMERPTALYDPAGERMILLDLAMTGARVFALELRDAPAWHRFCAPGLTPAGGAAATNAVLVPDGLFVSVSGGAFRFNLSTPYCD